MTYTVTAIVGFAMSTVYGNGVSITAKVDRKIISFIPFLAYERVRFVYVGIFLRCATITNDESRIMFFPDGKGYGELRLHEYNKYLTWPYLPAAGHLRL